MNALYESEVRHARTKPFHYALSHRTYYWYVDIDRVPRLARIHARDHLGDPQWTIRRNLEAFVGHELGQVFMLTQARVLGHVFNPLTVYWCHDSDGRLSRVVAEVHNTYGQQHSYLLTPSPDGMMRTEKEFYVSPFFEVAGVYRMRLPEPGERLGLSLTLVRPDGKPFTASLTGDRLPATGKTLARLMLRYPLSTLRVSAAIRWHGIRLYLRGLPVIPRSRERKGLT